MLTTLCIVRRPIRHGLFLYLHCMLFLLNCDLQCSLHVGSLLQIMILRHLQKAGHKPIVLVGGGTTKVGDPSGKDESRQLLDEASIQVRRSMMSA